MISGTVLWFACYLIVRLMLLLCLKDDSYKVTERVSCKIFPHWKPLCLSHKAEWLAIFRNLENICIIHTNWNKCKANSIKILFILLSDPILHPPFYSHININGIKIYLRINVEKKLARLQVKKSVSIKWLLSNWINYILAMLECIWFIQIVTSI